MKIGKQSHTEHQAFIPIDFHHGRCLDDEQTCDRYGHVLDGSSENHRRLVQQGTRNRRSLLKSLEEVQAEGVN